MCGAVKPLRIEFGRCIVVCEVRVCLAKPIANHKVGHPQGDRCNLPQHRSGQPRETRAVRNSARILTRRTMENHGGPRRKDSTRFARSAISVLLRGPPWFSIVPRVKNLADVPPPRSRAQPIGAPAIFQPPADAIQAIALGAPPLDGREHSADPPYWSDIPGMRYAPAAAIGKLKEKEPKS
jgi:hypothetical protein